MVEQLRGDSQLQVSGYLLGLVIKYSMQFHHHLVLNYLISPAFSIIVVCLCSSFLVYLTSTFFAIIVHGAIGIAILIEFIVDSSRIRHRREYLNLLSIIHNTALSYYIVGIASLSLLILLLLLLLLFYYVCLVAEVYGDSFESDGYIAVVVFFIVLSIPAIYLLGQLFFFHLGLCKYPLDLGIAISVQLSSIN